MAHTVPLTPALDANIHTPDTSVSRRAGTVGLVQTRSVQSRVEGICAKADFSPAWLDRVIRREGPGILRMLWRFLGSEQDTMDAYQDCFCKLAALNSTRIPKNVRAYAYRTAMNIATDLVRTRARRATHRPAVQRAAADRADAQAAPVEGDNQAVGRAGALRDAMARLPRHLRDVVLLRDLSRWSYKQVGQALGIGPATARVYRRHAVVKLAELMGDGGAP